MPPMPPVATDPVTSAVSILGIVLSGVQLGTQLQTYMELAQEAEEELHDIVFDINATSAALKQLHAIIDTDRNAQDPSTNVFKDDGVREVEMLALKCDAIYKNIIMLIQRASRSEGGSKGGRGGPGSVPPASSAAMALDPSTLKPLTFIRKLRWPWLRPRILRCHEQLNWLKVSLLFTLQMANIAQWQMSNRQAGISDEVKFNQQMATRLQERRTEMLHSMVTEREEQKRADTGKRHMILHGDSTPPLPTYDVESFQAKKSNSTALDDSQLGTSEFADMDSLAHADTESTGGNVAPSFSSTRGGGTVLSADTDPTSFTASTATVNFTGVPGAAKFMMLPSARQPMPPVTGGKVVSFCDVSTDMNRPSAETSTTAPPPKASHSRTKAVPQRLPDRFGHWADSVFGRQRKYRNDEQSASLEAYIAENDGRDAPMKIPFGHNRLLYGLDKVLKDWHGDPWTNYLALSPAKRLAIDAITKVARKSSNHEKACLAFKEYSTKGSTRPFILVFFSLSEAKDPIILHLEGRRYRLPFAACKTLEDVERRIYEACHSSPAHMSLQPLVAQKRYELSDEKRNIILPWFLMESIKPGIELSLSPQPHIPDSIMKLSADPVAAASAPLETLEKSDWRAGKKNQRKRFFEKLKHMNWQSRGAPLASEACGTDSPDMCETVVRAAQKELPEAVRAMKQVDYLAHKWKEEEIWATWRYMFVQKSELDNSSRLRNALWRAWIKAQQSLETATARSLPWVKDVDRPWLYGPILPSLDGAQLDIAKTSSLPEFKTRQKSHSIDFGVLPQRIKPTQSSTQPRPATGHLLGNQNRGLNGGIHWNQRGISRAPIPTGSSGWEPARTAPVSGVFKEPVHSKRSSPVHKSDQDPVREPRRRSDEEDELIFGDSRSASELSGAMVRSGQYHSGDSVRADSLRSAPLGLVEYGNGPLDGERASSLDSNSPEGASGSDWSFSRASIERAAEAPAESSHPAAYNEEPARNYPPRTAVAKTSSGLPRPVAATKAARVSSLAKHFDQLSREFEKERRLGREMRRAAGPHRHHHGSLQRLTAENPMRPSPSPAPLASGDFVSPHLGEGSLHPDGIMSPGRASSLSPVPSDLSYEGYDAHSAGDWEGSEGEPVADDVSFDDEDELNLDVLNVGLETANGDVEMKAWLEKMTNAVGVDWTSG